MSVETVFTTQLLNLMKTLSNRFPDDKDISLGITGVEQLKAVNQKKVVDMFVLYCYKFREEVMKKNDDFFLERDFITEDLGKDSDSSSGTQIMNNLKRHWGELDSDEKDAIWKYLQVLMTLSDKYIKKSLDK
tara:strand:+ start:7107 stop:7502 length:396 start_codon:yes stop_codon:yes gene_type:complete